MKNWLHEHADKKSVLEKQSGPNTRKKAQAARTGLKEVYEDKIDSQTKSIVRPTLVAGMSTRFPACAVAP